MSTRHLLPFFLLAALACTSASDSNVNPANDTDTSTPSAAHGTVATPTPSEPVAAPPEPTDADFDGTAAFNEKKNPNVTGVATLREVRSARHETYDRVVFEFAGNEMPTYYIGYIDKPVRACGSGNVVPLAGDGWLEMRFTDARAHTPEGQPTITDRSRSPNLPIVKDLKITCDFEAEVTWVAGVASPNRYRVLELKSPTRLVVDIKHK